MNEKQKEKLTEAHGKVAAWLVGLGVPGNWAKVGAGLVVGAVLGGLSTCQQGCRNVPVPTAEQVQVVHDAYHALSGKPCVLVLPVEEGK